MIDLQDHVVWIEETQTYMVPYDIVKQFLKEEEISKTALELQNALETVKKSTKEISDAFRNIRFDLKEE